MAHPGQLTQIDTKDILYHVMSAITVEVKKKKGGKQDLTSKAAVQKLWVGTGLLVGKRAMGFCMLVGFGVFLPLFP